MHPSISEVTQSFIAFPLRQINAICQAFDEEWSRGAAPDFGTYLERVPDERRAMLLRNMLHVELRHRRAAGEQPTAEEYLARLPQYADVIQDEFLASTQKQMSQVLETVTFSPAAKELALPAVVRLGDYVLEKELGRGAMGVVFAACHVRHGTRVALKTLPTVEATELHRFKQEFRTLADVNHPNLVGLHTLQEDGGQWFFTMDLVDGEDFRSYVRPRDQLDVSRLRNALSQLAIAVHTLHGRQIVHRDLKPSNVMVSREGELRVLDFGLVLDMKPLTGRPQDAEVGGTPAYMAPEQLDLQSTTSASDWYAVGVMLFEALVGKKPFTGSISQILADKKSHDPPAIDGNVPDDLARLCRRLLGRLPGDRPDAAEILGIVCPGWLEQAKRAPGSLAKDRLLGRESQLLELENAIRSFEEQAGARTIFISGRSGEGKTVLAEHFLERFRGDPGCTVLAGRCYDRESVPFKAVDTLIDALCTRLVSMPDADVKELLTPDAAVLAEFFPVLNRVDKIASLPRVSLENLELERVRRLAADALREIMCRLSQTKRLVCFIDDLQWGDAGSAELLLDVLRQPGAPHLLLLGTYRSDEAESSRFLQAWDAGKQKRELELLHTDCRLKPLKEEECLRLVLDIVGVDSEPVRQRAREMAKETGGNPFLLSELASCYDPKSDTTHPMQMEEVLDRKLSLLPADARSLLDVVSVSGKAISLDEASRTTGHVSVPLATINRMRTERLLRMVGNTEDMSIDTYHDRIRETVLRDMNVDSRKSLHIRLAEEIEASTATLHENRPSAAGESPGVELTNTRVYDLAYHFYEGGDSRAFGYQFQAGEAASRVYALENAIEHLTKAEQIMPDGTDQQTRFRLWERRGKACGGTHRLQEAVKSYENAQPFATGPIELAQVQNGIGEAYHRMGKLESAVTSFDKALDELGYHRPTWLPRVIMETGWLLTLCQMMWLVRPRKTEEARRRAEIASEVCFRLAHVYIATGNLVQYTDASARAVVTALRSGRCESIALGFGKLGYNNATLSLHLMSKWMHARAKRFVAQSNDAPAKAQVEAYFGFSLYCLGQLEESERWLRKSLDVLDRQGESWLRIAEYHHLRHIYSVRGNSQKELEMAEMENQMGEAASDPYTICWAQYGLAYAKARMGRLPEAHEHMRRSLAAIAGRDSTISKGVLHNHYGFVLLQSSEYSKAVEALEESRRIFENGFAYLEYVVGTYPSLIEGLVGPDWLTRRQDADIRRAKRVSIRSRFFAWRFPNIKPHALRVQGRLACASGSPRKAVRHFQKAVESARQLGAEYDLARGLLDLAAVSNEQSDALRPEAIAILKRLNAVIPYAEKWQLGDGQHDSCIAPQWSSSG